MRRPTVAGELLEVRRQTQSVVRMVRVRALSDGRAQRERNKLFYDIVIVFFIFFF